MYKIELLTLKNLSPSLLDAYEKLQQPLFKSSPDPIDLSDPVNDSFLALGATLDGIPVGLLLASLSPKAQGAEIVSLYVAEPHRRKKIASQMIEKAIRLLTDAKLKRIAIVYPDRTPQTEGIENFLHRLAFRDKQLVMAEFQFDSLRFSPPWFTKNYQFSKDFQIFRWEELTYAEAEQIKFGYQHRSIPPTVYPFFEDSSFEPLNSLGLRYRGKLVGWAVTKRLDPDTICDTSIFIEPELHKRGKIILLLIESIRLHVSRQVKWGFFKVNVVHSSGRWLQFIRNRLAPYADHIFEYYQSWHPLDLIIE